MRKIMVVLGLILMLGGCSENGGGGGGVDGDGVALTVNILPDCEGATGCTDVYIDGVKVGQAVPAGGQVADEVAVGVHTIYATGGCETVRIWGPFERDIPAAGWTETLSCAPAASVELTVRVEPACAGVERDIVVKMDEVAIATLQPGDEFGVLVSPGLHTLAARSAAGFVWGPVIRDLAGQDHTETFGCNPAAPGALTVAVYTRRLPRSGSCSDLRGRGVHGPGRVRRPGDHGGLPQRVSIDHGRRVPDLPGGNLLRRPLRGVSAHDGGLLRHPGRGFSSRPVFRTTEQAVTRRAGPALLVPGTSSAFPG